VQPFEPLSADLLGIGAIQVQLVQPLEWIEVHQPRIAESRAVEFERFQTFKIPQRLQIGVGHGQVLQREPTQRRELGKLAHGATGRNVRLVDLQAAQLIEL
jgi:hypothetical protein